MPVCNQCGVYAALGSTCSKCGTGTGVWGDAKPGNEDSAVSRSVGTQKIADSTLRSSSPAYRNAVFPGYSSAIHRARWLGAFLNFLALLDLAVGVATGFTEFGIRGPIVGVVSAAFCSFFGYSLKLLSHIADRV
jgi:hypothetical protein